MLSCAVDVYQRVFGDFINFPVEFSDEIFRGVKELWTLYKMRFSVDFSVNLWWDGILGSLWMTDGLLKKAGFDFWTESYLKLIKPYVLKGERWGSKIDSNYTIFRLFKAFDRLRNRKNPCKCLDKSKSVKKLKFRQISQSKPLKAVKNN